MMSEFPLLVFTVLTGIASGGYVMATILCLLAKRRERNWIFSLICLVLLGVGMLGVLAHLGHPERFLNALANPSAMITQEAYWSIPFGCLLLVDALILKFKKSVNIIVPVIGSVLGLGLMCVTSVAYFTSYGVAGWHEVPTLLLFAVGDLAMGATFATAFYKIADKHSGVDKTEANSSRTFLCIAVALNLALVVTLIAEAIVFANLMVGPWGFLVSVVIAVVVVALQMAFFLDKLNLANQGWIWFALIAIAVIVSRYAFYAMY